MRFERFTLALMLTLAASAAAAQQPSPNSPPAQVGEDQGLSTAGNGGGADFGFRGTIFGDTSDEARYQRYQDLRTGPFLENFRWDHRSDAQAFDVRATHVGYRDQQYVLNYNRYGKLRASFEFNQIPLWFSMDTKTPYVETSPGVLRLGALSQLVQNGASPSNVYDPAASPFDLRYERSIADLRLVYSATDNLDFAFSVKNTIRNGQQPWAGTFGFSDAVELPAPIDQRTTEIGVAAEWTAARGSLRVGYDSSMFRNNVTTLVWDNPLRSADSPTAGPAQGRMALWPDSDANSGSVSGVLKLPRDSQATAYVSLGDWTQDNALIPFTINSALASAPTLDRPTSDASARITATNFSLNSRPAQHLWFNARFRSYDFDNRTPIFHVPTTVAYDTTIEPYAEGATDPYSFTRKTVDLDAAWTPSRFTSLRAAFTHETVGETFRTFDTTDENTVRLSADMTGIPWLTLRAVYEHGKRVGSGLDEQSLDDIGEQVSLRQFDISDRTTDRFSAIVIATPRDELSFNATAFVGREARPDDQFGLRDNHNAGAGVGFDYVPKDAVTASLSYEYERYTALQASREANPGPQFDDPTRDWTTDGADHAHTLTASLDLVKIASKTDVRLAYDLSRAESVYVYGLAANTTLPPVSQLPPVDNTRHRFSIDGRYMVTRHLGAGLVYWFEKYDVNDFAFGPATLNATYEPSFLILGYLYRPYTASTIWARLTYLW
ncbi:MAG TPA: MtrB/PioB family outer membrane beta-barrel protein [Vicinamibacterales bacterium]|nr:MtrB/PioB family outer membrane beta-barrel protein [Vicinamibacterales bacterium]